MPVKASSHDWWEVASTIIDLTDEEARWRIMREGAIPAREISEFFAQG